MSYEITEHEASIRRSVEIYKYIRLCPTCSLYDSKSKVCDMCDQGWPSATDNNGKKPTEVQACDVYRERV